MKRNTTLALIKKEVRRFKWQLGILVAILLLVVVGSVAFFSVSATTDVQAWLIATAILGTALFVLSVLSVFMADRFGSRLSKRAKGLMKDELGELRAANHRAQALQAMASTLRATLSFERVVEAALDVCGLALEEEGIATRSLVGAVYLYKDDVLQPVASRNFATYDYQQHIMGESGIIGEALQQAEPVLTNDPQSDPEIKELVAFRPCHTVICVPLRAGFQIFGAMLLGIETNVSFTENHLDLFNSVADHTVIALQNAKLYQDLTAEKQRLVVADAEARKELARNLHDGPTQKVAAIAMRVNFIRTLVQHDPEQAVTELAKVEKLARDTSQEIRGMLFTLRPVILESEGLEAAIEMMMTRIQETDGLNMRLVGGKHASLLTSDQQSTVFSIVEEALGNARKYSEANLIEVRLWQEEDLFVARIQDDGIGFDVQAVNEGYSTRGSLGMLNMRERAERINGSLRVDSALGQGASITLVVPLTKKASSNGHGQRTRP